MIFPILKGIFSIRKVPITWLLFFLNCNIFLYQLGYELKNSKKINSFYYSDSLLQSQGSVFSYLIQKHPEKFDELHIKLSDQIMAGNTSRLILLGQLALRSQFFREKALQLEAFGDKVAFQAWRKEYSKFVSLLENQPNYKYGISTINNSWFNYLSYQFSHGGVLHLLGNMLFLLILGSVLEPVLGSLVFLLFYLLGGIVAALFYFYISGSSLVPLVGASGSISSLMGLYVLLYWKKKARFYYMILPIKEYIGVVMLPVPFVFCFWFLSDLSGYFSSLKEFGGVAYTAHIGGLFCGILFALVFAFSRASWKKLRTA